MAISNIVQKAIVFLLALIIVTAGLMLGPGNQAYDLTPYLPNAVDRAVPTTLTGGVRMAEAGKRCPPRSHFHPYIADNDPTTMWRWWSYKHTQAGPTQVKYYWKKQANLPFARVYYMGTKLC